MARRADLSGYSNADEHGHCFIPKKHFEEVMTGLGFTKTRSNHRNVSSTLRFVGEMLGIKVVLHCSTYMKNPSPANGGSAYYMVQSYDPAECQTFTHYHVKQWMPSNVQLSGKGSRTKGWDIYYKLVELLEPDDNEDVSYRDADLGV